MRLSKLQLYGFKSFADKTEFVFQHGMTAFVGPNGCGKSNVVDAVRWVLGEQRPRALRGSEMSDVIFKGNGQGRRSLGVAEVTITLTNQDRALPIEYDEVAIARRLYRSGESEYLINGQLCRLRDIRELLMDTGIGMDAYSIVEQGKIDLILQSNPKERRAIFEEAAGISKYNAKRRAALSKLERVEQNLLRLGDTIEEVRKRLRSIKRQAATARRFKQYDESLAELRVAQALHDYHGLVQARGHTERAIVRAEDARQGTSAALDRLEAEKSALEAETTDNDRRLGRLEARLAEMRAKQQALEESIRLNRDRVREADEAEAHSRQTLSTLAARLDAANENIAASEARAEHLDAALTEIEAALAQTRGDLQDTSRQCAELRRLSDTLQTQVIDSMRQRAERQNRLVALQGHGRALGAQRERHARRRRQIHEQVAALTAEREAAAARRDGLAAQVERARARFAARAEERGELRAQVENVNDEIAAQSNALSARTSRRELLEDLEARFEAVELGTQTLLGREGEGAQFQGMIADLVEVAPEHAQAIEAALGDAVQHLVADTLDAAAEAVAHLKAVDGGRTSLLPLDRLGGRGPDAFESIQHPGIVGRALDLVRYDEGIAPAVRHLLGDTFVVKDLDSAVEIARNTDLDVRLATLDGDVLQPRGVVAGGSEHERTGLLSRKNELRALAAEIEQTTARLEQLRAQRDHFINESAVLDGELEDTRQRLNELNLELATVREQSSRVAERERELRDEDDLLQSELDDVDAQLAQQRERSQAIAADLETFDERDRAVTARVRTNETQRRAAEERRSALDRKLNDLGVRRAHATSERAHLDTTLDRLRAELADIRSAEEHGAAELETLAARRQAALAEVAAREADIGRLVEQSDAIGQERVAGENRRAGLLERGQALNAQMGTARAALRQHEQQANELRLKKNEHDLRLAALRDKMREDHKQELDALHEDYEDPEVDWDAVRTEMAELKHKLDNMGSVNLLAIQEQAELEERDGFLSGQEQDLLRAKQTLQEVIRKVNRRSRQLFEQTFAAVREHFGALYRKLFGGGRADIVLEADLDVLEAGIEIVAKPPGKEPSTLRLLSGGEKSLTAVALLLAIFKSKPSPFCILDEVDAALDDANIGRFAAILNEFVEHSQFLIVTHAKQTMGVADALYGITMHEPGVSTHMGVTIDQIDDSKVA